MPGDSLFVMGDNRDDSYDGRYWGFLPRRNVRGTPILVYFQLRCWRSFRKFPFLTQVRWHRLFNGSALKISGHARVLYRGITLPERPDDRCSTHPTAGGTGQSDWPFDWMTIPDEAGSVRSSPRHSSDMTWLFPRGQR